MVSAGLVMMILAWSPFRIETYDYTAERMIEEFHPVLVFTGWFSLMFGLLHCPVISIKKWADRWNAWIEAARREKN